MFIFRNRKFPSAIPATAEGKLSLAKEKKGKSNIVFKKDYEFLNTSMESQYTKLYATGYFILSFIFSPPLLENQIIFLTLWSHFIRLKW